MELRVWVGNFETWLVQTAPTALLEVRTRCRPGAKKHACEVPLEQFDAAYAYAPGLELHVLWGRPTYWKGFGRPLPQQRIDSGDRKRAVPRSTRFTEVIRPARQDV